MPVTPAFVHLLPSFVEELLRMEVELEQQPAAVARTLPHDHVELKSLPLIS